MHDKGSFTLSVETGKENQGSQDNVFLGKKMQQFVENKQSNLTNNQEELAEKVIKRFSKLTRRMRLT